uniref:Band 4.1-like protein 5 n=1 Tax=Hydra vulgaris TaxID=6087 RepID=T2M5L9_HYDVU
MVFDALRRSLRNLKRSSPNAAPDLVNSRKLIACKIVLLDGTDISINLKKDAMGDELLRRVFLHLDLVEKDYFGLQFMDAKQVPHWVNPVKKVKKQVEIGPPYTLHFRVKFYALEPHKLKEELTRYQFFLQIKQDVRLGKMKPTLKQAVELGALAVQSEIGDFDATVHCGNYVSEFRLVPNQSNELEKAVEKKHRLLCGMNPSQCEINYLTIANKLEYYGMDKHAVKGEDGKQYTVGITPNGVYIFRNEEKLSYYIWQNITNITFKHSRFFLCAHTAESESEEYRYELSSPQASKHLWKCAIEYHTFFRLTAPTSVPEKTSGFLNFNSRFRYSGQTLAQATKDDGANARRTMLFKRTRSERFAQRSTIGYIRVGSSVWARALNGDYYKGTVTALSEKVHIKFENGDTISHERTDETSLVYDMNPNANEIKIGTRVIAHWTGLSAFLAGTVTKIEGDKYHVFYDDGDKALNRIEQMRILKPPLFFGPGSGYSNLQKKYSMKTTSLIGNSGSISEADAKRISLGADVNKNKVGYNDLEDEAFLSNTHSYSSKQSTFSESGSSKKTYERKNESKQVTSKAENVSQKEAESRNSYQNSSAKSQSSSKNNSSTQKSNEKVAQPMSRLPSNKTGYQRTDL